MRPSLFSQISQHTTLNRDGNLNNKNKLAIQIALSQALFQNPSRQVLQCVAQISVKLCSLISDSAFFLYDILNTQTAVNFLKPLLSYHSQEAGRFMFDERNCLSFASTLWQALSTNVTKKTLLMHLAIICHISTLFILFANDEHDEISLLAQDKLLFEKGLSQLTHRTPQQIKEGFGHLFPNHLAECQTIRSHRNKEALCGKEKWQIDWSKVSHNAFLQTAFKGDHPLYAGASARAARWLFFMKLIGFPIKAQKHYATVIMCFMRIREHHTFFECTHIFNKMGLNINPTHYFELFPEFFLPKTAIEAILQEQKPAFQKGASL